MTESVEGIANITRLSLQKGEVASDFSDSQRHPGLMHFNLESGII